MESQLVSFERDKWRGEVKAVPVVSPYAPLNGGALTTTDEAYQTIPYLYRGVNMIAGAVSRLPFSIEDTVSGEDLDETDPRVINLTKWMTRTLHYAALSLQLYGAAYFLLESNRFGLNTTPRYIPRIFVTPQVHYQDGLTGFSVSFISNTVPLNKMVYIWEPNPSSETAPGPASAYVALQAAGMLGALDQMTTQYFRAGAVPITAVKVAPSVGKDEREKIEGWFARMATGFRNAFKFLAVSQGTEFEQIGATIKDSQATELSTTQRENLAVALGVPPSVLDGKSTDASNSRSEYMGFYLDTVIPLGERIAEAFNVQLFNRAGMQFEIEPEKLEIMQAAQLEQAQTVMELTGGKAVMSQETGIEWIGLDPAVEFERMDARKEQAPPAPAPAHTFGASAASPARQATAEAPEELEDEGDDEQMKAWLNLSLSAFRAGSTATANTPFDNELTAASSANQIKRIYAAHWPKPAPVSWQEQAVRELARFNALAEGVSHHG